MDYSTRREFLATAGLSLCGVTLGRTRFAWSFGSPLLSFSSLGCPAWPFADIIAFAAAHGYDGVEMRGIQDELDLTKCRVFFPENRASSRRLAEDKRVRFACLGSSAELHHPSGAKRTANLDEARRYIDLARDLGCPHVRVFPNELPKDRERDAVLGLIAEGLSELARHAQGSGVDVLLESHGELVTSTDLLRVMHASEGPGVGLVWDVCNMWSVTKEAPNHVYEALKPFIRHTHIKDVKLTGSGVQYVLFGTGEAPVGEALRALKDGGYGGFYSFEWEKRWHPEIEAPEIALAQYPSAVQRSLASGGR